jgi:hypothetical protein
MSGILWIESDAEAQVDGLVFGIVSGRDRRLKGINRNQFGFKENRMRRDWHLI